MEGDTVGYVVEDYVPRLIAGLHRCDADMQAIRRWANDLQADAATH